MFRIVFESAYLIYDVTLVGKFSFKNIQSISK